MGVEAMDIARRFATGSAVAGAICALCCAQAAAAGTHVPPAAVPWVAQYSLEVANGSQNGSWTEHHQPQPPCDGGETGSGNEDVILSPDGSVPVFASGVGPTLTSIMIAATSDIPNPGDPLSVPQTLVTAHAAVSRQGSVQAGTGVDTSQCPSGDGGGTPPQPDCGSKDEMLKLWFSQQSSILHFEAPDGSTPGDPFSDCPFLGPGMFPTWQALDIALPLSGWGPPPPIGSAHGEGLPVQLQGETSTQQHDADIDATASERLTLRFAPLYVTPTIVLGDVASEQVGSDGAIGVPVSCPTGEKPGCRGTVTLAIDVATASSSHLPIGSVVTVAKASFSLSPGTRQRVRVRIAHVTKTYLKSLAQTPLALLVTVGGRHPIRYVAARMKLHA